MKRRLEGSNKKNNRENLSKRISSHFDRLTLSFDSAQARLEMYKEELREAKEVIEKFQNMYNDFYELAPIGYLTLDKKGKIRGTNQMAASLLGLNRSLLLKTALWFTW